MNNLVKVLDKCNFSKHIANHLLGESHSPIHRMSTGWGVIFIGICIVALGHSLQINLVVAYICDGIGYLIHGIGSIPTFEYIACKVKKEEMFLKEKEKEKQEQKQGKVI